MEKFFNLPQEKQNAIIDAALGSFGSNGYKKTSASDIAAAAGISKAMVFHYFGTKKSLYLYLIDLCGNILMSEIEDKLDNKIDDFFDKIKLSTGIKMALLKKHPAILSFLTSIYYEEDVEVKKEIKALLSKAEDFRNKIAFDGTDSTKFKNTVDPKLLMKMLVWIGEGYASQFKGQAEFDFDALIKEFNECLDMLKSNMYKEEYL